LKALTPKIGKLVNQAVSKKWDSVNEDSISIVKNIVKWGNFVALCRLFSEYRAI